MFSRSNLRSLTSPLKIILLPPLVFFWENASFSSYQRGKMKTAYILRARARMCIYIYMYICTYLYYDIA